MLLDLFILRLLTIIYLAIIPRKSLTTDTLVTIDSVHALAFVHARYTLTFIDVQFAFHAHESWLTHADERIDQILQRKGREIKRKEISSHLSLQAAV